MQSDILDEQYSIFCEVDANITAKYGQREELKRLGVSEKQEIIWTIERHEMPMMRSIYGSMSEEEQNIY